tara:strand:- start:171 stop:278 length:108 start_codon:yes stop_codon:yes gene_type:complete
VAAVAVALALLVQRQLQHKQGMVEQDLILGQEIVH